MKLQALKCGDIGIWCTITDVNVCTGIWIFPLTSPSGGSCEAMTEAENVSSVTVQGPPTQRTEPGAVQEKEVWRELKSVPKTRMLWQRPATAYNRCCVFTWAILPLAFICTLGCMRSKGPGGKGKELKSWQRTLTYMNYLTGRWIIQRP